MGVIVVRAREAGDVEAIAAIFACPGVMAGTLQLPFQSVDEVRARYNQPRLGTYSLVAEVDGRVVGNLGLHLEQVPRRRHCAGIGMGVHDDFQGRGVGSALMAAMADLADNWLNVRRI